MVSTTSQLSPAPDAPDLHPVLAEYVHGVSVVLDAVKRSNAPELIAKLVPPMLEAGDLLRYDQRLAGQDSYRRHLLYAEPKRRFTLLALIWLPGQQTPIHGHNAWCVVGVHEGAIDVTTYRRENADRADCSALSKTGDFTAPSGSVSFVQPDPEGIHRLSNTSAKPVITLHTYGMDLVEEPSAINKLYT